MSLPRGMLRRIRDVAELARTSALAAESVEPVRVDPDRIPRVDGFHDRDSYRRE